MTKHFCNDGCKESYYTDRRMGLIYGQCAIDLKDIPEDHKLRKNLTDDMIHSSYNNPDNKFIIVSWESGCDFYKSCYYCNSAL